MLIEQVCYYLHGGIRLAEEYLPDMPVYTGKQWEEAACHIEFYPEADPDGKALLQMQRCFLERYVKKAAFLIWVKGIAINPYEVIIASAKQ